MLTASLLASLALKSLALAALTLGILRLARGRTPAERSLIAHLGLLAIVLLPIGSILLPQWAPLPQDLFASNEVASGAAEAPIAPRTLDIPAPAVEAATAAPSFAPPSLAELAVWIYALPLALMFAMMAVAVFRLFAMRRRAEVLVDGAWLSALAEAQRRMGFKHGTALLVSEELRSPISWGVLRPTILLDPRAVSAVREAEAIIAHELAHVARLDWAKLLIARLACALFWFNPLVWLLARESHHLREEAADDAVLMTDIAGSDYATLLVNAARHDNRAVLIAAHGVAPARNSLKRRVIRVLDANASRGPVGTGWGFLGLASVLAIATPLAAFTTVVAERALPGAPVGHTAQTATAGEHEAVQLTGDGQAAVSADDLVSMRAMEVTPADVAEMRESGESFDAEDVIAAKATGVTPGYMAEMRSVLGPADADELVGARAVGVDAAYARAMRAADASADLDAIIGARAVGLTAAYVRELRAYFPRATLEELISMRAVGVTGKFVEDMRAAGLNVASPDDVISVRAVTSRPGPPPVPPRGPHAISVSPTGATAITGPGGAVSTHRTENGTSMSVVLSNTRSDPSGD